MRLKQDEKKIKLATAEVDQMGGGLDVQATLKVVNIVGS